MTLKKDKQKVLGEVFDEARIKSFLDFQPPAGVDGDYHLLEKAYRGMTAESFATFIPLFLAQGRNISARNPQGKTLLDELKNHRQAEDYINALSQHGAA